jgi:hypothetical protein
MTILYEPEISTAGHYEPEIPTVGHCDTTASHYKLKTSHYEITASHSEFKNGASLRGHYGQNQNGVHF